MVNLYLIIGESNVTAWNTNELEEVCLDKVVHRTFDNEKEKRIFIDALILADNNPNSLDGSYLLLDEDEYKLLTT